MSCSVSPGLCVICSIGCILMSSIVCPGKLKCLAMKAFACFLIEERWPDSRSLTFLFVSPTYCWSHLAQLIRYITLVVEHERSQALITVYRRLVKELQKKCKGWTTGQVAQCRLLHLSTEKVGRAGTFRITEQPMYVPPKGCPGALVNPGNDPAGMELFIVVFIIRIKEAREAI